MNIDLSKMKKYWFEDEEGNVYDDSSEVPAEYDGTLTYHSANPCVFTEEISEYYYHPKNWFVKLLCRNFKIYRKLSKGKPYTFKPLLTGHTTYGGKWAQDCIVAMVNSGDYSLDQAIWVFASSCERCMNALLYKYLDGSDGYPEFSAEWKRANTVCDFCRDITPEQIDISSPKENDIVSSPVCPFHLGDIVYELCYCDDKVWRVFPMTVKSVRPFGSIRWVKGKDPEIWNIYAEGDDSTYMYKSMYDLGKTLFRTEEHANAALVNANAKGTTDETSNS